MTIALIPVKKLEESKSRLLSSLPSETRQALTLAMLEDLIEALSASREITRIAVTTPDSTVAEHAKAAGAERQKEQSEKKLQPKPKAEGGDLPEGAAKPKKKNNKKKKGPKKEGGEKEGGEKMVAPAARPKPKEAPTKSEAKEAKDKPNELKRDFMAEKMARKVAEMPDVDPELDLAALRKAAQKGTMTDEEKKARGLLYDTSKARLSYTSIYFSIW